MDVQPSIRVDVNHGNSRGPPSSSPYRLGTLGDVFKLQVALVEIKLVGYLISNEIQIRHAIIVNVSKPYSSSIVEVLKRKDI